MKPPKSIGLSKLEYLAACSWGAIASPCGKTMLRNIGHGAQAGQKKAPLSRLSRDDASSKMQ